MHYEGRLQQLGLWTLEERRNWADLIEVFKIAHGFSKISLSDIFRFDTSGKIREHSLKPVNVGAIKMPESISSHIEWLQDGICWTMSL